MKFKIDYDTRIRFRDIYFLLFSILLISFIPLKSVFLWVIIMVVMGYLFKTYDGVIFFENPYIYFKRKEEQVSPINDSPIRLNDITGYNLNNPFSKFCRWCKSSTNITLHLFSGKQVTFSVIEQSMVIDWLNQNNIRNVSRTNREAIIEHIVYTILNLFFIVFYTYQIKKEYTDSSFTYLIISVVCFIYWIIYIFSGLYIRKKVHHDETII